VTARWFPDAMPKPAVNHDTRPFFEAAVQRRLVMQRCRSCGTHRHPPRPICPHCGSSEVDWDELSGRGTLFTYSVVHQPFHPAMREVVPYVVVVVELEGTGGVRLTSNLVDAPLEGLRAGLPVEVVFEEMSPQLTLPRFVLAPGAER
jgi:uncharacterized protein